MSLPTPHAHPPFFPIRATLARHSLWQRKTFPAHIKHKLFNFFFFSFFSLSMFRFVLHLVRLDNTEGVEQAGGGKLGDRHHIYFIWAKAERAREVGKGRPLSVLAMKIMKHFRSLTSLIYLAFCLLCAHGACAYLMWQHQGLQLGFETPFRSFLCPCSLVLFCFLWHSCIFYGPSSLSFCVLLYALGVTSLEEQSRPGCELKWHKISNSTAPRWAPKNTQSEWGKAAKS